MLTAGVAAGFGACFGTPIAGAIFALEVLAIGRIKFDAIIPALLAAGLADLVCVAWGTPHIHFNVYLNGENVDPFGRDGEESLSVREWDQGVGATVHHQQGEGEDEG